MHIKQVIIDGFKSYAKRTVCGPFDNRFNAITGLNGSGKSNILDSICFVLGISKLAQVRVDSLQGLVYKNGQAGITKASVTIVFDNRDPSQSPIGYEDYDEITVTRQIVINGRNKYMINGHNAQQKQVQTLFHSVGLNVNNPHFLIMQGRITKVLNMNPKEILGLLEEAAGTRMFEDKKNASKKTMVKKEEKVKEIDRIIMEEITPNMKKLKDQRDQYQEWSRNNQQFKRDERFVIAFDYSNAVEELEGKKVEHGEVAEFLKELQENIDDLKKEKDDTSDNIQTLTLKKEEEIEGDFKQLQQQEEDFSKALVKANTVWENSCNEFEKEKKVFETLEDSMKENDEALEETKKELDAAKSDEAEKLKKVEQCQANVDEAERQLQALSAGMAETAGETQSLSEQLSIAERNATEAATTVKVCEKQIKHASKAAAENKKQLAKEEKQGSKLANDMAKKEQEVEKLSAEVSSSGFDDQRENELLDVLDKDENDASILREQVDNMWSRVESRLRFDFSTPYKGFDRSSVKGIVAQLLSVKQPKFSTALEVTAGGKLYNVVVDTEKTAKAVLQNGKLKRRVTIIPLNKIARKHVSDEKLKLAQSFGADVTTAINLIGYPEEVEAAMAYIFGSTLICEDAKTAEKVTFHDKIRLKSVTKDGDVYDPAGTLSGGSRAETQSILLHITKLNEAKEKLHVLDSRIAMNRKELKGLQQMNKKFAAKAQKLEVEQHKLQILKERMGHSKLGQLQNRQVELEATLQQAEAELKDAKVLGKESQMKASSLKKEIEEFNAMREKKMSDKEDEIKTFKKDVKSAQKDYSKAQSVLQKHTMQIEQFESDKQELATQVEEQKENLNKMEENITNLGNIVEEKKKQYEDSHAAVEQKRLALAECDRELKALMKTLSGIQKKIDKMDNDIKNQEHKMKNFDRELEKCKEHVNSMEKEHEWIATEKEFFGEVGSDYDFEARNAKKVMKNMAALKIRQEALEKKINRKVMGMIQRAEKEYTDLIQKKRSLEDDRHKIEEVIATLDIKKKTAIEKTWAKVTDDFGAIFTDLLPGTSAKLEPEDGKSVIDGVRVRVAFSGVWKESLSELSGGQRSLVALSLILALLRFKPAPMYILDEVDAALDLSHTQNIGMMLRKHFTNSQFVVVSLKEGMFNNANCIFRTKFVDGMSTVRRSTPMDKKQQEAQNLFVDNANNINNKKKGKNKKSNKSRKALSSKN